MAMNLLGSFPDLHITFLADRRALKRIPQELSAYLRARQETQGAL